MKALCFGSLNIDYTYSVEQFVRGGETRQASAMKIYEGGKGLNQAIALSRAGLDAYMAGAVGNDGQFLLDFLRASKVSTEHVKVESGISTGHAIIQNDAQGDNCILLFGGANRCIGEEHVKAVFENFGAGDWLLLQNEINGLDLLIRTAKEKGMTIVLNPSPMEDNILSLPLECVDYLMVNEIEAAQILGHDGEGEGLALELWQRYPDMTIVLTLGSQGSVCCRGGEINRCAAEKVSAVDTTAAGDTYTGFFVSAISRGQSVDEAMSLASRAAAISVTRRGASPSIPDLSEVI